jgi:hypothetical protein
LFSAGDIGELISLARLPPVSNDYEPFARRLDRAFYEAQTSAMMAKDTLSFGQLRHACEAAIEAGHNLLLVLGLDSEPSTITAQSRVEIATASGLLKALVRWAPPEAADNLPEETVECLAPGRDDTKTASERRLLAGNRLLVEAARGVAYLVTTARNVKARPPKGAGRRGPAPDAFTPVLLDDLVFSHREIFGEWPVVGRDETGEKRGGPAVVWLRAVLELAESRMVSPDRTFTLGEEMKAAVARMVARDTETLPSNFEKAISRIKRGKLAFRTVNG